MGKRPTKRATCSDTNGESDSKKTKTKRQKIVLVVTEAPPTEIDPSSPTLEKMEKNTHSKVDLAFLNQLDEKEAAIRLIRILNEHDLKKKTTKVSLDEFVSIHNGIVCCPVSEVQYTRGETPQPPKAPEKSPPTPAEIKTAYGYLAELGEFNGSWNQNVSSAIKYIGELHGDCGTPLTRENAGDFLAPIIHSAVTTATADLTASTANLTASILNLTTLVTNLTTLVSDLTASFANMRQSAANHSAVQRAITSCKAEPLFPLAKVIAGDGVALPGGANRDPPDLPEGHPFAVGTIIRDGFPTDSRQLRQLSLRELDGLAVLYNDNFGVLPEDDVETRREKFSRWISGLAV